ncbi:MAG: lipid II flippase Amj family protein [Caulobacter sp.]|nr:lipid II flippase Amj family protein [Caulobacter sp.]
MDAQLFLLCVLTFVIHLIGALAYAVRIAGVRTRRIAMSFALFNVLVLLSRTSNAFQGPFLSKRVETNLLAGTGERLLHDFQWLMASASLAALVGALAIPTAQRLFTRAVAHFQVHRSIPKLLMHAFAKGGLSYVRQSVALPSSSHLKGLKKKIDVPVRVIVMNVLAQALLTVGVFASLYAGYLDPQFRLTASNLSSVINGVATILLFVLIDPSLSIMTDDVMEGRVSEPAFRRAVVWFAGSRVAGTVLAQVLFVPAAMVVAALARLL